jgi:transcriptional regulator with XRE-family HTH domain
MDLKQYLDSRNFHYKEFAEMIGVSATTLSNYMHKRREPRPAIREKIVKATHGKVTILDLLKK